jgi:hypothetical protein
MVSDGKISTLADIVAEKTLTTILATTTFKYGVCGNLSHTLLFMVTMVAP